MRAAGRARNGGSGSLRYPVAASREGVSEPIFPSLTRIDQLESRMSSSFVVRPFAILATASTIIFASVAAAQSPALSPAARPVQPSAGALVIVGGGGSTPAIWDRFM